MIYKFSCPKCNQGYEIEIPIDRYPEEKTKQYCINCNTVLQRVLEWSGSATINGGYESVAGRANWQ